MMAEIFPKNKHGGAFVKEYMSGYVNTKHIKYCPNCGEKVRVLYSDGTAKCQRCNLTFSLIICDEPEVD